ncbi:hypothetical protein VOLCADRAFT_100612 [Volvox carteri f. nagariensis]|uniref:Uncharacterized protein n=1 Tax=Volvox carteri f. nagariensis TaxID=3068 RepID=D8UKM2_VOLCA|nr:uncharacterized protein VOLCADRAFT_100612 [Volvox carteri f. nagariensis]EFJ39730.1 hypothetical protein VOLCADRAFT_100612 [Volvox carteri f. nagariensis]|eukprot:XP_002959212.1 hypothetical protein VOLCADRAFT_100612 [Volvox carteri f. nagariensis]
MTSTSQTIVTMWCTLHTTAWTLTFTAQVRRIAQVCRTIRAEACGRYRCHVVWPCWCSLEAASKSRRQHEYNGQQRSYHRLNKYDLDSEGPHSSQQQSFWIKDSGAHRPGPDLTGLLTRYDFDAEGPHSRQPQVCVPA